MKKYIECYYIGTSNTNQKVFLFTRLYEIDCIPLFLDMEDLTAEEVGQELGGN